MVERRTDDVAQDKIWSMIRNIRVATMVTVDDQGRMRGRPMRAASLQQFDGTLWFFTADPSPKVREIIGDGRVLLAYADPVAENYASLSGTARIVQDPARQRDLWSEALRSSFPAGPDAPSTALIEVTVHGAEYWDVPSSSLVQAYGYVKARLTGEAPDGGANEKVAFRPPG